MPEEKPNTADTEYSAPLPRRLAATTVELTSSALCVAQIIITAIENAVKSVLYRVEALEKDDPNGIRERIQSVIGATSGKAMETLRKARVLEKVDLQNLPDLDDDKQEDIRIKGIINDILDSRLSSAMSFEDEMEFIGKYAFNRGIPTEKLIRYFEDSKIIDLTTMELLRIDESGFRATSLYAACKSAFKSGMLKLKSFSKKLRQKSVDEETETAIVANIEDFKEHYNPSDDEKTLSAFIAKIKETYKDYNIGGWLKKNKHLLRYIFLDTNGQEKLSKKTFSHVHKTVMGVYEHAGQRKPEQFMDLSVGNFFEYESNSGDKESGYMALYRRLIKNRGGNEQESYFEIHTDRIVNFFIEIVPRLENRNNSLIVLRRLMIKSIRKKMTDIDPDCRNIIVNDPNTSWSAIVADSNAELMQKLESLINKICTTVSSHISVNDLLVDPTQPSPEIEKLYEEWFDEEGELKSGGSKHPFYNYLRQLFRFRDEAEGFENVRQRVGEILQKVNEYLVSVARDLGIPPMTVESVVDVNDYLELVKLHCNDEDPAVRFAARRKIELATLFFSCQHTPLRVYQGHHAVALKKVMESRGGVQIDESEPLRRIEFLDFEDGKVDIRSDSNSETAGNAANDDMEPGGEKRSVELIPATFGKTKCYLLPTKSEDIDEDDPRQYMGKKSFFSMVTNLLTGEKRRAKDLTDLVRMTFVVDSFDDLAQIQQQIEEQYLSFGRTLKRENRYGEFVNVATFQVSASDTKSNEYKTLRYVADVPITDEAENRIYMAPLEIRVMLVDDLLKEQSKFNDASHEKYEQRRLYKVLHRISPAEIFPQHYKQTGPRVHDAFQDIKTVPKTAEDYRLAA